MFLKADLDGIAKTENIEKSRSDPKVNMDEEFMSCSDKMSTDT